MFNQKGFIPLLIIPIIALLGLGFAVGVSSNKALIANIAEQVNISKAPVSTSSATLSIAQATKSPRPTSTPSASSYNSTKDSNSITISGNYTIPDFYKINYNFTFPRNGGDITGSTEGLCTGKITGSADAPDKDKQALYKAHYEAKCQPIPGLGFKTDAKAEFDGMIDYNSGKVHVLYHDTQPIDYRGGFDLFFNP